MRAAIIPACFALISVLLSACASVPEKFSRPGPGEPSRTIYLVSQDWHAGIVIKRSDIPPGTWPQHNDFPEAEYLEVGWGDRDYYMTPSPHIGITIKAGLFPTASVLHIVGFSGSVTRYFPGSEVIQIEISEAGFHQLCSYIENSYARDEADRSRPLGSSLYGTGQFYLSHENYHAFNTCNVWTARGLREAGFPLTPSANLTIDTLMMNAAKYGTVIQHAPPDLE